MRKDEGKETGEEQPYYCPCVATPHLALLHYIVRWAKWKYRRTFRTLGGTGYHLVLG